MMLAKIAALVAHEVHARFVAPVVAEYRKLDAQPDPPTADPVQGELSCTSASTERAAGWDHDTRPPVRMGFGKPQDS